MASLGRHNNSQMRMVLLVAFLLSFILLLWQRGGPNFSQPAQRKTGDLISPIAQILSRPIRSAETIAFGIRDRSRAYEENVALRKELDALRDKTAGLDLLTLKLKRYERILSVNLKADIPAEKIVARAVSETNGPLVRSLLLNVGTNQGVNIGNPVLSADGLIGHVINAGKNSSRILQLGDLNSRIPVMNRRNESKAILSGNNSDRPVLTFIQDTSDWLAGDIVLTSGDDGMLPIGLPVGVVAKGKGQDFNVRLHAQRTAIDWVWVSPYSRISAPPDKQVEDRVDAMPDSSKPNSANDPAEKNKTQNTDKQISPTNQKPDKSSLAQSEGVQ